MGVPVNIGGSFQGLRRRIRPSLASEPLLDRRGARRRLHRPRHAVRELHPSDHHSLDAAVRRRRRAARAHGLAGPISAVIALIGIILLIGIVKKNAILMIDFALEAERSERHASRGGHLPAPACCASARSR